MRLRVLGPIELCDGTDWVPVPAAKQRALLAVLALHPGRALERNWLVDALWNGRAPASATRLLAHYVWRLRELMADHSGQLLTVPSGYLLDVEEGEVDHGRFATLLTAGRKAAEQGDLDQAVDRLTAGLDLWRGPALADAPPLPRMEESARRLDQLRMDAREALAEAQVARGRPMDALAVLEELTDADPFRERAWSSLMLVLYRLGRRRDALETYQRLWHSWTGQLGVEPGEELRDLHRRVLNDDPSLAGEERPVAAGTGRATQAGRNRRSRAAQLPGCPLWFTGRTTELHHLLDSLRDNAPTRTAAVAVIDGMAGIGKTALAVYTAHRLAPEFPDGQLFIDLHGFAEPVEPSDALERMLWALGVSGDAIPDNLEDRAALWRSVLADRRMLLVLDNAASEDQVRPLLPASAKCLALVTSRVRMVGLDTTVALSLDVMTPKDAEALLVGTVGRQRLDSGEARLLAEVVELCGRLPLAIRIAAARLKSHPAWGLAQLADRLRDQTHRLRELEAGPHSVAAAVELSYRHLSPAGQRLYRLLGLHPGADSGADSAAALADTTVRDAERVVEELAGVHLLDELGPGRYRFHDLLRLHAARIVASEATAEERRAALTRLFDHYVHAAGSAVEVLYPYRSGQRRYTSLAPASLPVPDRSAVAAAWLDDELPNLLAAADHAGTHGFATHLLRLSAILDHHLRERGRYFDAEILHRNALVVARHHGDPGAEIGALTALGYTHRLLGRHGPAVECFERALTLGRDIGDRAGELAALQGLGHSHRAQARYDAAAPCFEQALAIARDIGDRCGELPALHGLGYIHRLQGAYEAAAEHFEQMLKIARELGYRGGQLGALSGLGYVNRAMGRYEAAAGYFQQALDLARTVCHRAAEVGALWGLGQVEYAARRYGAASACFARASEAAREIGDRNGLFEALHGLGLTDSATGHPDSALAYHRSALELADELDQPVDRARALNGMANAHRQLGQLEHARRCWRWALDLFERHCVREVEEVCAEEIRANLAASTGSG